MKEIVLDFMKEIVPHLDFMKEIVPNLESAPFVDRYAWFDTSIRNKNYSMCATSSLIGEDNKLTNLGEWYAGST